MASALARPNLAFPGVAWPRLVKLGLACPRLAAPSLAWLGLANHAPEVASPRWRATTRMTLCVRFATHFMIG